MTHSYNCNLWWRLWVLLNLTTSDAWSQIMSWSLPFLRMPILSNNYAVVWVYFGWCTCFISQLLLVNFSLTFRFFFNELFKILITAGCSRGNQDQLCWISYQADILWVSSPFWCSCSRSSWGKVSPIQSCYCYKFGNKDRTFLLENFVTLALEC